MANYFMVEGEFCGFCKKSTTDLISGQDMKKCTGCKVAHYCSKKCQKDDLKNHIDTVHDGKIIFQCSMCNAQLSSKRNLKNHIAGVHEGIKSFQCTFCDKQFAQNFNLKHHLKTVHEGSGVKIEEPDGLLKSESIKIEETDEILKRGSDLCVQKFVWRTSKISHSEYRKASNKAHPPIIPEFLIIPAF